MPALPRAFLSRRFTPAVEAVLRERFELTVNEDDSILPPQEIARRARGAEVLFVTATEVVDAQTLQQLALTLRTVATLSVGFNHIDVAAARSAGIHVLHTPDVLTDACADVALMLVLNACRRGYEADRMVRSGKWPGWAPTQLLGIGLVGRKLGIFGMGRIGRAIAHRARGFGLQIHYHNRTRLDAGEEQGARYHASLEAMLAETDILVISAPASPSLRGVINAERLALLPRQAVVVNVSRGDLVQDDALIDALRHGRLRAAGLDVFANEPNVHPGYRDLDNVFLTPHIASATEEARDAMGRLLIDGLAALARGQKPANLLT